jgi:Peptidase MA superfamily
MRRLLLALLGMLAIAGLLCPVATEAQSSLAVTRSTAEVKFPLQMIFSVSAKSDANISDIRLRYSVDQESFAQVISEAYVTFAPGTNVNAQWTMDMRRIGGFPPGTTIHYWWVIKNVSGARTETDPAVVVFDDNRYKWQTENEGLVNLYWYSGAKSFADQVMSAAQEALDKLAEDTGAGLKNPVKIYVYASTQDLLGALIFPYEWTGAVTFSQYGSIAIGMSPANLTWGKRAIAHELAHMVIHQVTLNPYSDLPRWLDEGLAVYSEGLLDVSFSSALKKAVESNSLMSVRTLSSPFSANSELAALSYAESFSFVSYLISTYGEDKMHALLEVFSKGSTYDNALQSVYGFDSDGLNDRWLQYANDLFRTKKPAVSLAGAGAI